MRKHVDQKANYLLGQPISFSCENDDYAAEVKKILGMRFMRTLKKRGSRVPQRGYLVALSLLQ